MRLACLLAIVALSACRSTVTARYSSCYLAPVPMPAAAAPGEHVVLQGGPLTTLDDVVVRVGGARATLVSVDRPGCNDCDTCRTDASCGTCGQCDDCTKTCASCEESTTFVVPDLPAGAVSIVLFDAHGVSVPAPFEVLSRDTGADSGL